MGYTTNITQKHGDNMRLFVATFKPLEDQQEIYLATTDLKAKELLTSRMKEHLEWIGHDQDGEEIPDDFDDLQMVGWNFEYYYVDINSHKVHSDEHVLKYVMEEI